VIRIDDFDNLGLPPVDCDHQGAGQPGCEVCDPATSPEYTWPVSQEWLRVQQLRKYHANLDGINRLGNCHNGSHPRMLHKHSFGGWFHGAEAEPFA
jgi:hypothetical protein